jgi:hypothetical protein
MQNGGTPAATAGAGDLASASSDVAATAKAVAEKAMRRTGLVMIASV